MIFSKFAKGAVLLLAPTMVLAQPALTVGSASGGPGDTVTVPIGYTGDGAVENFQGDILFDSSVLTFDGCPLAFPPPPVTIDELNDGQIRVVSSNGSGFAIENFFPSGVICQASFTIAGDATAPSSETLELTETLYFTAEGQATPSGESDGTITIQSGPPPASLSASPTSVSLTAAQGGSASSSYTFTAVDGDVTGISCTASGDSEISFSSAPTSVDDGDTFSITATCSSSTIDSYSASLSCAHDDGETSVSATCSVTEVPPAPAFDPQNGGTLFIGPLVPGSSGSRAVTFRETAGVQGYSVSGCALDDGSVFSVSPSSVNVPAGGSATVTVTANSPSGVVSDTLTCTANGSTYSITVTVGFQPLVVPTLQQWGMIIMALALAAFGFVTMRRRDV